MADDGMIRFEPPMFTDATVLIAEGARVGIVSCRKCGAAILLDPRDPVPMTAVHSVWHLDPDLSEPVIPREATE